MATTSQLSIQEITQQAKRLRRDEFVTRVNAPLLIDMESTADTSAKHEFLTEAIAQVDLVRHMQAARGGCAFLVRKCVGGLFSGHVGVGRTANLDIPIARPGISKFHAYFSTKPNGQYQLTDKGSKNGTFVDGRQLKPGAPVDVPDGAIIRFAVHSFCFMSAAAFYDWVHGMRSKKGGVPGGPTEKEKV